MASNFNEKLIKLLKKDLRFVDEDNDSLIRNEIINFALKADKDLIGLLIKDDEVRNHFFDKIEEYYVFNINKFIDYVEDKNFLSNSYTKFKNQIGLNIDGKYLRERGEVSLVWPFKDCVLEGGMTKEDQKRNEIFFNQTLAKDEIDRLFDTKALTNFKKFTTKGEEKLKDFNRDEKGTIKDNLIIKGNNLLALHSLKKEFAEKIKLIYIDPPYNTGGSAETFTYNNSFNHSTWLTFMKNRLEVAKDFLREDGFIAIAIDHEELFYLGTIADEIFGRDNRIGLVSIVNNPMGRQNAKFFSPTNDFMIVYAKNSLNADFKDVVIDEEKAKTFDENDSDGNFKWNEFLHDHKKGLRANKPNNWYPIYVSNDFKKISFEKTKDSIELLPINDKGIERSWMTIKTTTQERINCNELIAKKDSQGKTKLYYKFREQQRIPTHWCDKKYNSNHQGVRLLQKLISGDLVSYPKSLHAVLDTLKIMTSDNDIIMDFFGGSGTTAHATLSLNKEDGGNRRFILIEQLDAHMDVILKRIQKVIELNSKDKTLNNFNKEEHFIFSELKKYNEESIDKIQDAKDTKSLLKIWDEMVNYYFLNYNVEIHKFNKNKADFEKLSLAEQKKLLCEMLNKNQLYVNLSEIDDKQFNISKEDKDLNSKFYGGN